MAYGLGNKLGRKTPLFFFYDCEATDLNVEEDRIIEVAAVIHLASLKPAIQRELKRNARHDFSSLCSCDRELGEVPQRLTGLTRDRLRDEPPLEDVLKRFFEWVEVSIATANRLDQEEYTPVLVAHGGNRLDFPLLVNEVERFPSIKAKFHSLDVRYIDTFSVLAQLSRMKLLDVKSLSMGVVYQALFQESYDGHRALADAQALCKIFTEAKIARNWNYFLTYIQNREEMLAMQGQVEKFKMASIGVSKAAELLAKGITYEVMAKEYHQGSKSMFKGFLRQECNIGHPRQQRSLIQHFESS